MTHGPNRVRRAPEGGLLEALRARTRGPHDALDARAGALDLGRDGDLARLLAMNEAALGAILRAAPAPGGAGLRALPMLLSALRADLRDLGCAPRAPMRIPPPDPWAAEYVVLGSRLGTRVLWRRRLASAGANAPAGRYLSSGEAAPGPGPAFRALAARLAARPAEGAAAERTLASAAALFALFDAALKGARPASRAIA